MGPNGKNQSFVAIFHMKSNTYVSGQSGGLKK